MSTDYLLRRNGDQFEPDGITIECHAEFGSDTVTIKISDGDFHHCMSADDYAPLASDSDALRSYFETQHANHAGTFRAERVAALRGALESAT